MAVVDKGQKEEYWFEVEPFHTDFKGHLSYGVLGNHLLNVADISANNKSIGFDVLSKERCAWVLSRLVIEMNRMPQRDEKFCIETWVENVYRLFTDRNFAISDENEEIIGYARSVWAMINLDTRKPLDLLSIHEGRVAEYLCDRPCPIDKPTRLKIANDVASETIKVKYGDIDINGHVNSIRYIEHILDVFPVSIYKDKRVKRFEIAYIAESVSGDSLSFYVDDRGDDIYDVEVKKNDTIAVCRARAIFE